MTLIQRIIEGREEGNFGFKIYEQCIFLFEFNVVTDVITQETK